MNNYKIYANIIVLAVYNMRLCVGDEEFTNNHPVNEEKYIFFCLCMGRFGNQIEHLLGGMAFAKEVGRTLIIPPLRTYKNVHFDEWFDAQSIMKHQPAILAADFMENIAPTVWPADERTGFCIQAHNAPVMCDIKSGNPFANFWDELNITFKSIVGHSVTHQSSTEEWKRVHEPYTVAICGIGRKEGVDRDSTRLKVHRTPTRSPTYSPVVALKGAPASFPIRQQDEHLQTFIDFSQQIIHEGDDMLMKHFNSTEKDYVAVHLRNGMDWVRACALLDGEPNHNYMASYQCNRWNTNAHVTNKHCLPDVDTIVTQTKKTLVECGLHKLLIATDQSAYTKEFQQALGEDYTIVHVDPWLPVIDAYLLSNARHFIGNCVSSFSSFVSRQRRYHPLGPTSYFGWENAIVE